MMNLIINAIFRCSFIFVILLFIAKVFNKRFNSIDRNILIQAAESTLLLGSLIYLGTFAAEICRGFFSGADYEQFALTDRMFGKYWWAIWIFMIMPYGVLPQALWIKKLRGNTTGLNLIIWIWAVLSLFVTVESNPHTWYPGWGITVVDCLEQALIYLVILASMYFILSRRKKH